MPSHVEFYNTLFFFFNIYKLYFFFVLFLYTFSFYATPIIEHLHHLNCCLVALGAILISVRIGFNITP